MWKRWIWKHHMSPLMLDVLACEKRPLSKWKDADMPRSSALFLSPDPSLHSRTISLFIQRQTSIPHTPMAVTQWFPRLLLASQAPFFIFLLHFLSFTSTDMCMFTLLHSLPNTLNLVSQVGSCWRHESGESGSGLLMKSSLPGGMQVPEMGTSGFFSTSSWPWVRVGER